METCSWLYWIFLPPGKPAVMEPLPDASVGYLNLYYTDSIVLDCNLLKQTFLKFLVLGSKHCQTPDKTVLGIQEMF